MTDHAPIDQPILQILNAYNPLEIKDILLHGARRNATKHKDGRLHAGAAVGVSGDMVERTEELVRNGLDVIFIDTAHAHSKKVIDSLKLLKRKFSRID